MDKLQSLLDSRRVWVVGIVLAIIYLGRDKWSQLDLTSAQLEQIVTLVGSWLLGHAVRPAGAQATTTVNKFTELFKSRRFLLALSGVVFVLLQKQFGESLTITEEQIQRGIEMLAIWIVGDSLRETRIPAERRLTSDKKERRSVGILARRRRKRNFGRAGRLAVQALADTGGDIVLAKQKLSGSVATWAFLIELAIKLLPLLLKIYQQRGAEDFELSAMAKLRMLENSVTAEEDELRNMATVSGEPEERHVLQWLVDQHARLSEVDKGDVDDE